MLLLRWSGQEWRRDFLLPGILLFSSPCLYFLSGWPAYTSCLANQRFIKIHDWQNTENSPGLKSNIRKPSTLIKIFTMFSKISSNHSQIPRFVMLKYGLIKSFTWVLSRIILTFHARNTIKVKIIGTYFTCHVQIRFCVTISKNSTLLKKHPVYNIEHYKSFCLWYFPGITNNGTVAKLNCMMAHEWGLNTCLGKFRVG